MAGSLTLVTATVFAYFTFANPVITPPSIPTTPYTQMVQSAPTQVTPTQVITHTPSVSLPTITPTRVMNPVPQDAPPMALRIIDNTHSISQTEVESIVEPNLVLISESNPSIRNVNPARIKVDKSVIPALESLYKAAEVDRVNLSIRSAYRSYEDQARSSSQASDKTTVVLPGYSQHHSGLAIDFTTIDIGYIVDKNANFEGTKAGKWLANHAWEHGFIPAYTANHQSIANESWHYIYVGQTLAKTWHDSQSTATPLDYFALVAEYQP